MGSQDVDFRDRLSLLQGARLAIVKSNRGRICGAAIPNNVDDKVENCDPAFKLRWAQMDARNRETLTARKMAMVSGNSGQGQGQVLSGNP